MAHAHDHDETNGGGAPDDLACNELVEIVTEYVEGALTPSERARVEAHLRNCPGCTAYVEQMRETIRLTGRLREDDIPADVRESLLDAFRDFRRG